MSENLSYETKIEFLERQIKRINNIDFQPGYLNRLSIFENQTKKIFVSIFEDPNEYIKKLEDIRYTSSDDFYSEPLPFVVNEDYFYSGRNEAEVLLRNAVEDVKLERELLGRTEPSQEKKTTLPDKIKVFIVHGSDDNLTNEVARFIEKQGLEALILHEQVSRGNTIIEKIEANSNVGFAIILYTPCDFGRASNTQEEQPRARQNVIFEHGFFVAKLGRSNVVALHKGNVEIPNNLSGIVYTPYDKYGGWKHTIARELKESGYKIDFEKI